MRGIELLPCSYIRFTEVERTLNRLIIISPIKTPIAKGSMKYKEQPTDRGRCRSWNGESCNFCKRDLCISPLHAACSTPLLHLVGRLLLSRSPKGISTHCQQGSCCLSHSVLWGTTKAPFLMEWTRATRDRWQRHTHHVLPFQQEIHCFTISYTKKKKPNLAWTAYWFQGILLYDRCLLFLCSAFKSSSKEQQKQDCTLLFAPLTHLSAW